MKYFLPTLIILLLAGCSTNNFGKKTLLEWSKKELPDKWTDLNQKGRNNVNGNILVQHRKVMKSGTSYGTYFLKTSDQDSILLEIKNSIDFELVYFEFYESNLFLIFNIAYMVDRVQLYNFDLSTGDIFFNMMGQLPCRTKFEFNWKLGNEACEWVNFVEGKLALANLEENNKPKLSVYNWRINQFMQVDTGLEIGLSSNWGYIVNGNINYNKRTEKFEFKNDY